jgi:site-specific DNA-methyltransferase (adenine-specific)
MAVTKKPDPEGQIIHGSCEDLSALADESVSLTVTSPPYWNAIDYDRHAEDPTQWYRTRQYSDARATYAAYIDWLTTIFRGVREKTKPGGLCAVVIGTLLFDKKHHPIPFDLVARMTADGWLFHQDIIWNKVTGGVKRAGVYIQKPFPGYFHPNIMTEYILVFRREGEPIYRGRSKEALEEARNPINRLFTSDIANTVWHVAPVPPGHLDHPCPFPEEIPARLVSLYSYPGELVLDPFCGSGQTLKVAAAMGRRVVGYETVEHYVRYATKRLTEPLSLREKQLIARFEKIDIDAPLLSASNGEAAGAARRAGASAATEGLFGG